MNVKKFLAVLFLFSIIIFSRTAFAQVNYSDTKVDDLTDVQIRQLIQRAESMGYSDAQLEQLAAAQGMKPEEIQKLRLRVEKIRKQDGSVSSSEQNSSSNEQSQNRNQSNERSYSNQTDSTRKNNLNKKDQIQSEQDRKKQEAETILGGLKPKIFGLEVFKNDNQTFEPNLRMATPKSYIVGPDDELLIDLTGDNEANYRLKVSPDGTIRLQYVGLISVGGLSIEQATSKIRSAMTKTYAGLRTGRSNIAVNLGNIRGIKIVLTGEVTRPGTYTLSSLSTVFNALYACGGPNENGSFRKIQVIRNNKVISTIDTYDYLIYGIQKGNIRLQDQDIINVPVYETRIEIVGEVKRSALFEIIKGEMFEDVLQFAGGFRTQAYSAKVKVLQNTDKERRITDILNSEFKTYTPRNGDKYIVESILDRFENRIEILGAVFRPGQYELSKGLTVKSLINKADGLKEDAFLNRGYINRLNSDNTLALLSFDVAKIMDGRETDIPLQREDRVTISSLFDLRDEYKINIQGEVRFPGEFDYADNMNLEDAIQIAGGFREGATPSRIEVSRRVMNSDASSITAKTADVFIVNVDKNLKLQGDRFILKPFDVVSVRSSEGYSVQKQVKVEGEVLYPGIYTILQKNERISDLIKRAGGLTPTAYADGASLKRPGPDKSTTKKDKNAIDNKEENDKKLMALKRAQESGAKDTTSAVIEEKLIQSDLVGIDLKKILSKPESRVDLILEDGDNIRVPKQLQTVKVTGEVLNPNSIVYAPGRGFKQYLNGAGGFTRNALRSGAYIKYANGSVEASKSFLFFNNYPKVKPGAEILVPRRAERERMTAASWIGIGTAFASLAAVIVSILR
ncbi:SLBB domain-containing protein [Pedobacter duraquae]|uniref:Protein involved in polysaccharide export with SLBB domain n=1 Tax=Pedobacter duraquae TaxID=425511 RepID=A0A4R6IIY9_9SPHI|nr:SLBB domain-containing protein [Pedobacter duraquae]TDO21960.1 protein involved in polysaccharide export with SLBB domain [Pedobacter duraquae]